MAYNTLFTHGPANVDYLLATTRSTILKMGDYLQDQVFTKIALLRWLQKEAQVTKQGGASILVPMLYAKANGFKAYAGDEVIDTTGSEGITVSQATWRNYGGPVTITGTEIRQNAGEKLFDLVKAKTEQSMMTLKDRINIDFFQSTQDAKKVQALPILVDATSTVQDVNSTTSSWWQAQVITGGSFAARGQADMRNARDLIMQAGQGGSSGPSLVLTTRLIYELYEASLVQGIRYESRDAGDASFGSLKWSTANVDFDPNVATGEMYLLPSDALKLVVHSDAAMTLGEFKEPVDQDIRTAKLLAMLNLVTTNRRRLAKITSITA